MSRNLNKVFLIGNLTRDPEERMTPGGSTVVSFGLATNRNWTQENGEKKEDVEFHKIIVWNKLAQLCMQSLKKGHKIYAEGRIQTRKWKEKDGQEKQVTEIIVDDIIFLTKKGGESNGSD